MSLSKQTVKRLPTITDSLLKGLNYTQIGAKCGVTEKTIDRDINAWVESGRFETWIKKEWVRLHNIILHEDPTEAYRNISKLVGKMITHRMEVKEEISERIEVVHLDVTEDEDSILNKAASILDKKLRAKKEPAKIH